MIIGKGRGGRVWQMAALCALGASVALAELPDEPVTPPGLVAAAPIEALDTAIPEPAETAAQARDMSSPVEANALPLSTAAQQAPRRRADPAASARPQGRPDATASAPPKGAPSAAPAPSTDARPEGRPDAAGAATASLAGFRPKSRPAPATVAAPPAETPAAAPVPRPRSRPETPAAIRSPASPETRAPITASASTMGFGAALLASIRPSPRPAQQPRAAAPERVQQAAAIRPAPGTGPVTGRSGALCGNPAIRGEAMAPIVGRISGCGVARPVRVTSVEGVSLSQASIMDCDTANALATWVRTGVKPAVGGTGGGVRQLQVAAHYVCRTRNHRSGARLSEHAKGRAIDISGITLVDGRTLTILRDWRGPGGQMLRAMHRAACGPFGTTLGPGSDGMHEDHLHLDTARHRRGNYCR